MAPSLLNSTVKWKAQPRRIRKSCDFGDLASEAMESNLLEGGGLIQVSKSCLISYFNVDAVVFLVPECKLF